VPQALAVELEPRHAVEGARQQAAEVFRRLLEAEMIGSVVAGVQHAGVRMPVEADRVTESCRERLQAWLRAALIEHQHPAAAVTEGIARVQILVTAVATDAETDVDAPVGTDAHGTAAVSAAARQRGQQTQRVGIEACLAVAVARTVQAVGLRDKDFAVAQRHTVRVVGQANQHFGPRVGWWQPVHMAGFGTR